MLDIEFDDVIDKIFLLIKNIWDEFCIWIKNGFIFVREIENYCFSNFIDEELYVELVVMNRGRKDNWINERIN